MQSPVGGFATSATQEQRTYARLVGILLLVKYVTELGGDSVTIIARRGETFAQTAAIVSQSPALWRFCLLNVELAWITLGVMAFALYVLLEPVNKRLAQLALGLRLGAAFLGAAGMMFRFAQARLHMAAEAPDVFTIEQLRTLASVSQRGAGAGIVTAWVLQGAGGALFFLLLLRSRFVPAWVARLGILGGILLVAASLVMIVFPHLTNELKLLGVPGLLADVVTAVWLLSKGPRPGRVEADPK